MTKNEPVCTCVRPFPPRASQPTVLGSSRARRHPPCGEDTPVTLHRGSPTCFVLSTPDLWAGSGKGQPSTEPWGEQWQMSPTPSRHHKEQTKSLLFWCCSAPADLLVCTQPRHRSCGGWRSFLSSPAGSSRTGAASARDAVSCVTGQCWGRLGLLTLYSFSWPWMVSRCTRVQVRAMAVEFKILILTSVGAALGSE